MVYSDTTGVTFISIVTSISKFCKHFPAITKNLLKCRRFNLPGARDWSLLDLFWKMPKCFWNLRLGPRGWRLELGKQRVNLAGFERVALDLLRNKCIQNLASVFQTLDWNGGRWLQGGLGGNVVWQVWGAKVSQLPVPLQTHYSFIILFFHFPSEDNWRIRILNSECFPLQEIMKKKRKPRKHFWNNNPVAHPEPSTSSLILSSGAGKSRPHWWNVIEICL